MKRISLRHVTSALAFANTRIAAAKAFQKLTFIACLSAAMLLLSAQASHAGSATWSFNPGSGDWNTATNWTPAIVPNGPGDTATFALSNTTGVSISANTEVTGIVFNSGASAFTITASPAFPLTISGAGITNNSGITQNFVTAVDGGGNSGTIFFTGSATAGSATFFTNNGSALSGGQSGNTVFYNTSTADHGTFESNGATVIGIAGGGSGVQFFDSSTADHGTFVINGATVTGGVGGAFTNFNNTSTAGSGTFTLNGGGVSGADSGGLVFFDTATAGNGTFTCNAAAFSGSPGSLIRFESTSTAGDATFTNNGSQVSGAGPGVTQFIDSSTAGNGSFTNNGAAVSGAGGGLTSYSGTATAGNATLSANGGAGGGGGGGFEFFDDSAGGAARVEVFGNGFLRIDLHNAPGATTGSIEGNGVVFLGANNLIVGSNNLSTTFSGLIQDGGANGSFAKVGAGVLTFEGGASNDHIANTVTLSLVGGSTVNLNFTGNADAIGGLVVDGVAQPAGLYGSAASGAPNQLSVFGGTGIVLVGPPVITSPMAATGTLNVPFSYQIVATGATSFDVAGLPEGLSLDSELQSIVGTPVVEGTFQIELFASNDTGTTSATLVLTVQPFPAAGPVIMSVTSATGRTGSPFTFQVATIGGSSAVRISATGLPAGLAIDSVTGEISGTATTDGSFAVTLLVTEAGITDTATLQLTFTSDPALPVIVSANSAFLFQGLPFSYQIEAPTSDSSDPVAYSVLGLLPPGLSLDPETGVISGFPRAGFILQPMPSLAGGLVSNTQIFACNSSGCAAQGLDFLLPNGTANISTRLSVGTGDNVLIGGFITVGNAPMKLVLRGIGPTLPAGGLLADPFLELHSGALTIASNDNWKDNLAGGSQETAIKNTGLAPVNELESAILAVLEPGLYTGIVKGAHDGIGVGLVEVYNLGAASMDASSEAHLANISTRGFVQTGDDVMIGGFINEGAEPIKVLVRGKGPSLTPLGVTGALADPILELHKPDGTIITNSDWTSDPVQKADIMATGLAPTDPLESAILLTLPVEKDAGYTAIVRGVNDTTGVGLVEAYFGNPCLGSVCP